MLERTFYIVDVFAIDRYTGNQLAVFANAEGLSDREMQALAQEMNYSETTFILGDEETRGGYDVRIFTPARELPFAGHPTLGTAYILRKYRGDRARSSINLNLKVGQIPVTVQEGEDGKELFWMKQNAPTFQQELSSERLADVLSLNSEEIDENFPIQEVSTGIPFIIVPLKKHLSLKQIKLQREKYFALIEKTKAQAILVFCPETNFPENQLSVRVFGEALGVIEDPATGSANGCLAGYLARYDYFGDRPVDIRVEQGYEIARPSLLFLKATKTEREIEVLVGGKVIEIAKGQLV
ncbi:MAG: PhzF family phenazine biosynthesis protein [Spirulina sp.]